MRQIKVQVANSAGIHARPAGIIASFASKYQSDIIIIHDNVEYDAKSVISVMGMGADQGDQIIIRAEGSDEIAAVAGIVNLIANELK